ncbi:MAG: hypothetical protein IJ644_05480 [Oscillospiraceae bacterium]|nr:hypothetical protein [Oscillospiraceae bacterium]
MQTDANFSHYPKCQVMMRSIKKHNSVRLVMALILLFLNIPVTITPLATRYGIIFVIFALLYTAGVFISFLFAVPETPKFCIIPAILIFLGILSEWIAFPIALLMLLSLAWVVPDYKKLKWLKEQSGYPQFSERFDEQMQKLGKGYQPEHHFDHIHDAQMKDAFEETPAEESPSSAQNIEMPDVPEIPERPDFYE